MARLNLVPTTNSESPERPNPMARSDLLLSMVKAGASGDQGLFRRATEALIAEERGKQHLVLAQRLDAELQKTRENGNTMPSDPRESRRAAPPGQDARNLLDEVTPCHGLSDLVLPPHAATALQELVEEQHRADLLRSHNLEPRHRVLLSGPPGNGKTSIAEGLAYALMVPLLTVRYDALVGSYLGETASRLRQLFDYCRSRPCVLFFDEFDTLGKERGDTHDSGEIKRVVSSLLLQIDDLPPHVVVVTATNHPELLDRAVWRRFQLRLELPRPSRAQLTELFSRRQKSLRINFGFSPRTLADKLRGASFSEADEFIFDLARRQVLASPDAPPQKLLQSRLEQWRKRVTQNPLGDATPE